MLFYFFVPLLRQNYKFPLKTGSSQLSATPHHLTAESLMPTIQQSYWYLPRNSMNHFDTPVGFCRRSFINYFFMIWAQQTLAEISQLRELWILLIQKPQVAKKKDEETWRLSWKIFFCPRHKHRREGRFRSDLRKEMDHQDFFFPMFPVRASVQYTVTS